VIIIVYNIYIYIYIYIYIFTFFATDGIILGYEGKQPVKKTSLATLEMRAIGLAALV
jgi:hypothetical protein